MSSDFVNRDVVLADFQACTGIDDIGLALTHLEESGWNLLNAIHRVVPENSQTLPSERSSVVGANHSSSTADMSKRARQSNSTTNHVVVPPVAADGPANSQSLQTVPTMSRTAIVGPVESSTSRRRLEPVADGSDSSDIEDLDLTEPYDNEDFFVPDTTSRQTQQRFLITDNVEDETTGTILFSESFIGRYGPCHPMFFHGTLDAAVKEATSRPARDRRLLAIYLHHDESVQSNIFCQQVLCSEGMVNLLSNHFVVWGWDVTHESNRQLLLNAANRSFGTPAVGTIRSLDKERYPVIMIVSRARAATEIVNVVPGHLGLDEAMVSLLHAIEVFRSSQLTDMREEEEREARERVILEQNQAYEESLRADMAKDEAKRVDQEKKKREEDERMKEEEKLEAERRKVFTGLPPEPSADSKEPICTLRCRLPNGKIASRKFLRSSTLRVLFDFLFSEGYSKDNYKVLFSHPKRDLTELYEETQAIGTVFSTQDTLIVEER